MLAKNPTDTAAHFRRSVCLSELGRHEEAREAANQVFRYPPNRPCEYNARAQLLMREGKIEEALRDLEHADANRPYTLEYIHSRGTCLLKLGRYAEALLGIDERIMFFLLQHVDLIVIFFFFSFS